MTSVSANRRKVLRALGAATLGSLAGCTGDGSLLPRALPGSTAAPEWDDPARAARLVPDDGDAQDEFGVAASLSQDGTTALVGARHDDPNGELAGSAYVFTRVDGSWRQEAKLAADDGDGRDLFGHSVALAADGSTALVGAFNDEGPERPSAGSAYVFTRSDGSWSQQTRLSPDGVDWLDSFGESVALSRDGATALVGAPGDEDPNGVEGGSAYVLSRTDGTWRQQARLAPEGDGRDFGRSVALAADGTVALVAGQYGGSSRSGFTGSAHVFSRSDSEWSQQAMLAPETDEGDDSVDAFFGHSVALAADGSRALVGAPGDEEPNGREAGAAYLFSRVDGSWRRETKLAADDGDRRDYFGFSVGLAGNGATAVVGATTDEDPNGRKAGSAYVFSAADGTWSQAAKLAPEDGDEGDLFGESVDLAADGRTALVGSFRDDIGRAEEAGSAYVYQA